MLEETGVEIRVERLASVGSGAEVTHVSGDRASYLDLTFACTWIPGEAHVADDESVNVRWWPIDGLPDMKPAHLDRIGAALSGKSTTRFRRSPAD